MTVSADGFSVPAFCLIFAPLKGYDEPEILLSHLSRFCLIVLMPDMASFFIALVALLPGNEKPARSLCPAGRAALSGPPSSSQPAG